VCSHTQLSCGQSAPAPSHAFRALSADDFVAATGRHREQHAGGAAEISSQSASLAHGLSEIFVTNRQPDSTTKSSTSPRESIAAG